MHSYEINKASKERLEAFDKSSQRHLDDLFLLITSRGGNISNVKKPSYEDHLDFCLNNPYRYWLLYYQSDKFMGAIYITNENVIGINFFSYQSDCAKKALMFIIEHFEPAPEIKSVVPDSFHCNIAPKNKDLIKLVKSLNAKLTQSSYKFCKRK